MGNLQQNCQQRGKKQNNKKIPLFQTKWVYKDTPTTIYSRITSDLSSCTLPILSNVPIRVELVHADPSNYVICPDANRDTKKYKLELKECTMLVKVRTMAQGLASDLEKRLAEKPLVYPMRRIEPHLLHISASLANYTAEG